MKQWNISVLKLRASLHRQDLLCTVCHGKIHPGYTSWCLSKLSVPQPLMEHYLSFLLVLLFLLCLINIVILLSNLLSKPFLLIQQKSCTISPSLWLLSSTPSAEQADTWHEETGMLVKLILCVWPFKILVSIGKFIHIFHLQP